MDDTDLFMFSGFHLENFPGGEAHTEFSTSIYITPKIHIYLAQNCLTHARDLVVSKFNVCFTKAQVACKLHMNYGLFDARP